jgi:hypothetical protein
MMRLHLLGAVCALCLSLFVVSAANASIIYNVDRTIGTGTVTGFIQTDGTLGGLNSGNITDWAFTLTAPNLYGGSPNIIDFANATQTTIAGSAITATATLLQFNFDLGGTNYLIFQGGGPYTNYWCLETSGCTNVGPGEVIAPGPGGSGFAQSVSNTGTIVFAEVTPVPVPATVWLFGSGLLGLVRMARRKKTA